MTTSQNLSLLRDLQTLREERAKAEHSAAVSSARLADADLKQANLRLAQEDEALTRYAEQGEIDLHQFQIMASLVNQREDEVRLQKDRALDAQATERSASDARLRAEKQSEQLSERHAEAIKKERRKLEDRKAREFLPSALRNGGAKP